jgi:intracellular multiplication protein IcmK
VRTGLLSAILLIGGLAPVASLAQDASSSAPAPPPVAPADPGLNSLDPAGKRAVHNAIPFTPEMIQELQRRYGAAQQAEEQATQQVASPVSRMVSVTFAPGQATSIIQTVRG